MDIFKLVTRKSTIFNLAEEGKNIIKKDNSFKEYL